MKIEVCTHCGSADIEQDAYVHLNDRENVKTFDDLYCCNCDSSCRVKEVEVPDNFDIYSDIHEETANEC